jgi:ubiquinone/menaquinone biosynthesis C-methylase UbiE
MERIALGWGRVAREYAQDFWNELDGKPFDRDRLDAFARRIGSEQTVLEVGCGPGQIGAYLADRGVRVLGLDLAPEMVAMAMELRPDSEFIEGNVLDLPFADDHFDGAVAMYSLINLVRSDLVVALTEIHRVLRPGSPLQIGLHQGDDLLRADEIFGREVEMAVTLFMPDEVHDALVAAGFRVEVVESRDPYEMEQDWPRLYATAAAQ